MAAKKKTAAKRKSAPKEKAEKPTKNRSGASLMQDWGKD